jgi:predicted dienelactone hydrolase
MRIAGLLTLLLVSSCASSPRLKLNEGAAYAPPAHCSVEMKDVEWRDEARQRDVPARLFLPTCDGSHPLIVFSHGLANSREGYRHFADYWSARGYAVVIVQHHGSDSTELKEHGPLAVYRSAKDRKQWRDRPLDISFAIDQMERLKRTTGLNIDTENIGVAGHSYGAYTALASAGMLIDLGEEGIKSLGDRRVKSVIAISTPKVEGAVERKAWEAIELPVMHLTGTRDRSLLFRTSVRDRLAAFENMPRADGILVMLKDAGHSTFSNDERRRNINRDLHGRLMQEVTLAFWDSTLRHDAAAAAWLKGGVTDFAGEAATVEHHAAGGRATAPRPAP